MARRKSAQTSKDTTKNHEKQDQSLFEKVAASIKAELDQKDPFSTYIYKTWQQVFEKGQESDDKVIEELPLKGELLEQYIEAQKTLLKMIQHDKLSDMYRVHFKTERLKFDSIAAKHGFICEDKQYIDHFTGKLMENVSNDALEEQREGKKRAEALLVAADEDLNAFVNGDDLADECNLNALRKDRFSLDLANYLIKAGEQGRHLVRAILNEKHVALEVLKKAKEDVVPKPVLALANWVYEIESMNFDDTNLQERKVGFAALLNS